MKPLWSCNFESDDHSTYFNVPNDHDVVPGNNPGEVVTTPVHKGTHAGYYHNLSNDTGDWVRNFWNMDWGTENPPTTHDLLVEAWIYLPTMTLTGPLSFITLCWTGFNCITVDIDRLTLPNRYLKLWNGIFDDVDGYQDEPISLPFDQWVKLQLVIHYKPAAELSSLILYQDDVEIVDFESHAKDTPILTLRNVHFGLYAGYPQQECAVYNDDLNIWDLNSNNKSNGFAVT